MDHVRVAIGYRGKVCKGQVRAIITLTVVNN